MNLDAYTIIFLALAVFVFFKLRSVLGQRTGHEQRPPEPPRTESTRKANDNVLPMPGRGPVEAAPAGFRWQGIAEEGSALANGFDAIAAADPGFDAHGFVNGAKAAYEMIVNAFNSGDRKTLRNLLSPEVFASFNTAISERETRGETVQANFVSVDKAEIVDAALNGKVAEVGVNFRSQVISAIRDKAGEVIDGSLDTIEEVTDLWRFARDTSTSDPNWRVVATDEG